MKNRLLLALYPEAWRDRYGEEMSVLIDETSPGLATTLDLLGGAFAAHLRPLVGAAPETRARGTVTGVLGCFIIFCFFGAAFAKTTENYDYAEHVHPVLGVAHSLVLIAAIAAACALVLAAVPLARASFTKAWRTRGASLTGLIALPPAGIGLFAGSVGLLVLWLNAHHHRAGVGGWLLLALCGLSAAAGGFACWASPRAIMRRVDVHPGAFVLSICALALVALCMGVIALATGVFLVGIVTDAPRLGAEGVGPGQLIDVTTAIAIQLAAMLGLTVAAVVSAARGLRCLPGR